MKKFNVEVELPDTMFLPLFNKNKLSSIKDRYRLDDLVEGDDYIVVKVTPYNIDVDDNLEGLYIDSLLLKQELPDWFNAVEYSYSGLPSYMLYKEKDGDCEPDKYDSNWFYNMCLMV